ncbi:MAG: chromosome segregation ATPase, partial [Spirillospora sp.]
MPNSEERDNSGPEGTAAAPQGAVSEGAGDGGIGASGAAPAGERAPGGGAEPRDTGPGPGESVETAVARLGDPVTVWPCANCGRPVPQPVGAVRAVRYCQDNDGACA